MLVLVFCCLGLTSADVSGESSCDHPGTPNLEQSILCISILSYGKSFSTAVHTLQVLRGANAKCVTVWCYPQWPPLRARGVCRDPAGEPVRGLTGGHPLPVHRRSLKSINQIPNSWACSYRMQVWFAFFIKFRINMLKVKSVFLFLS